MLDQGNSQIITSSMVILKHQHLDDMPWSGQQVDVR